MEPRVSVVVAVYNPGPLLERLVDSLLWQTLPAGEYEVILVDDGSTDGSGRRVDELAARHPHFSAMHIPNSGWPGRPRNRGLDAATGRYVYFVDHDDWLTPEALERLVERADRNEADVVIGKEVGHGFGVPLELFARNIDDAKLGEDPLLHLLTPHKLFRRSMLVEHGVRFPEGRRRLEDHHFVVGAYLAARRISILADHPCYHWAVRPERANATHSRIDPVGYYANMRDILDIVDRNTEPGPLRDRLYVHWYLSKTLHKLRGPGWVGPDPSPGARRLLEAIRAIVDERFPPRLDALLPARYRITACAVRSGSGTLVAAQAVVVAGVHATAEARSVEIDGYQLHLAIDATLADAHGVPLRFAARDDRVTWSPPAPVAGHADLEQADLDVTEELSHAKLTVLFRHRETSTIYEHPLPWPLDVDGSETRTTGAARVAIDLETVAAGGPLSRGTWDVFVNVGSCGFNGRPRLLGVAPAPVDEAAPVRPFVTSAGNLAVTVLRSDGVPLIAPPDVPEAPPSVAVPSSALRRAVRRALPEPARRAIRDLLDRTAGATRR